MPDRHQTFAIPVESWQTFLAERVKPLNRRAHAVYEPVNDVRLQLLDVPLNLDDRGDGTEYVGMLWLTYPTRYRAFHVPSASKQEFEEILRAAFRQVVPDLDAVYVDVVVDDNPEEIPAEEEPAPPAFLQPRYAETRERRLSLVRAEAPAPEAQHPTWLRFMSDEAVVLALLTGMHMVRDRAWITVPWWRDDQVDAEKLCQLAIAAHARGVDVRVLMRPLSPHDYGIDRSVQVDLVSAGVPVRLNEHVHAKTFLLDGIAVSGSTNLTRTDVVRNPNDASLFAGPEIRRVESQFRDRWEEATPVRT